MNVFVYHRSVPEGATWGETMTDLRVIAAVLVTAGFAAPALAVPNPAPSPAATAAYGKLHGDAAAGAKTFVVCKTCHVVTAGVNRIGPSLHGVVGRKAGTIPNFQYSAANKNSGITWTEAKLFEYLEAPQKIVPGTKMSYPGLKPAQDRANVIAYLKTQG